MMIGNITRIGLLYRNEKIEFELVSSDCAVSVFGNELSTLSLTLIKNKINPADKSVVRASIINKRFK